MSQAKVFDRSEFFTPAMTLGRVAHRTKLLQRGSPRSRTGVSILRIRPSLDTSDTATVDGK